MAGSPDRAPMVMTRSRRLLAVGVATAVLLAACGGDATGDDADRAADDVETPAAEPSADTASAEEGEGADQPAGGADDGGTITVQDATGEVTIPVTDEGVYVLDEIAALTMLILDVEPIGVERFAEAGSVTPIFDAEGVDAIPAGSLEPIAAARPDLILGISHPRSTGVRDQHAAIAPVVYPDFTGTWLDQMDLFAVATGRMERATRVAEVIDERVAELRGRVDEAGLTGSTASVVQFQAGGYYAHDPSTLIGTLLDELGFVRSELQSGDGGFGYIPLSEETLGAETDADVVFGIIDTEGTGLSVFDSPTVDVSDTPHTVVTDMWIANHAFAAWLMLDDIEAVLFGDGSAATVDEILASWEAFKAAVG
ncbi:MAG: ABC transporter substrate-binding protein [Actinomycetota bacterium]